MSTTGLYIAIAAAIALAIFVGWKRARRADAINDCLSLVTQIKRGPLSLIRGHFMSPIDMLGKYSEFMFIVRKFRIEPIELDMPTFDTLAIQSLGWHQNRLLMLRAHQELLRRTSNVPNRDLVTLGVAIHSEELDIGFFQKQWAMHLCVASA